MERVVAIDARMLGISGIGTYLTNLLENFAAIENEFVFEVICPRKELLNKLPPDRFRYVPGQSPIYSVREQWEIARLARHAQVLHSPHYNAPLLYQGNLVVTIHDLIHVTDPTFKGTVAARFYARPMFNLVARRADCLIADSEFTKTQIVEHLPASPSKVVVVYLGVSDHFCQHDREQTVLRVSSLLGVKRPYILFVGNLKPHKNVKTLLHAFSQMCVHRDFDHQLVILSDDRKWKVGLVNECEKLGIDDHVLFAPHVRYEDLPWVYGAAEILVMPSFIEGFGLPVLEAMACGTPVVCSRAASLPEVAGDAAEYFEPTSVEDLAAAVERVLNSEERQAELRQRGLERVKQFSWYECARRHCEVYRKALQ
ncbi:MAG: glycosyltransferase family 1 protein [Terriglobia bacterium]|jgi:glycosyltransferase involved in cell wall biosynthesis